MKDKNLPEEARFNICRSPWDVENFMKNASAQDKKSFCKQYRKEE
jgi:hypothetical protein